MWIYWLLRSLKHPEEDEDLVQCFKFPLLLSKPPRFTDLTPPWNAGASLGCTARLQLNLTQSGEPLLHSLSGLSPGVKRADLSHQVGFFYLTFLFKSINNLAPWYLIKLLPESSPAVSEPPFPPPFSPSDLLAWLPCGLGPSATLTLRTS